MAAREWVRVSRTASGVTTVTVTKVDGDHSARWTTKAYFGTIADAVAECRKYADHALDEMKEAS